MEKYAWLKNDKFSIKGKPYALKGDKVLIISETPEGLCLVEKLENMERFYIKNVELSEEIILKEKSKK